MFFIAYRTGKMSSSWCVVLVAAERFLAVWFPLKVKTMVTKGSITVAIVLVFAVMLAVSGAWTISTDIVNGVCLPDATTEENLDLHKKLVVVGAVCYSIAPVTILCTITPPIIIKLVRQRHRQKGLHSSTMSRFARETTRTTVMLTAVVALYIVCVTPITLVLVLTFWTNEPIFGSQKREFIILTSVAQTFEQVNHALNFIIYVLSSRQFRLGFLQMTDCRRLPREDLGTSSTSVQVFTSQTTPTVILPGFPDDHRQ